MKSFILAMLFSVTAFATTTRQLQIDTINATGGSALTVPSIGGNLVSDTATQTVSNKTFNSTNTFNSGSVAASALSGQVSVANGGTGAATLTAHGVLIGAGTSAVAPTSAGTALQPLVSNGASSDPTFQALTLSSSTAVSGQLGVANGGTGAATLTSGSLVVGAGTSAVTFVAPGSNGNVLQVSGGNWTSAAAPSPAPIQNSSQGTPASITAGGGVTLSGLSYQNDVFINASAIGTTTVTATPSMTACTQVGQEVNIWGVSTNKIVVLQDEASLSGSKLHLNGNWSSAAGVSQYAMLVVRCDGNGFWNEKSRNN